MSGIGWTKGAAIAAATIALSLGAACGGGRTSGKLFTADWSPSRSGQAIDAVYKRLKGARPPPSVDVAVGIAGNGDKLVGVLLDSGARWSFSHALDARPVIVGDVVVASGGGELFALDAKTGRKLWARPTGGLPLIGAGDDGAVTVATLGPNSPSGTTLLAVSRDGDVRRQIETDKDLGVPAVASGLAFVPWGNQYVSVLDIVRATSRRASCSARRRAAPGRRTGSSISASWGSSASMRRSRDALRNAASHVAIPHRDLRGRRCSSCRSTSGPS